MDAVCVGNATIDVFILLHRLQKFTFDKFSNQISFPLGEKITLDEYKLSLGGNACNVGVGLSRLGLKTAIAAEIGSDEFSQKIENGLKKENLNLDLLIKNSQRDEHFNIALCYDGERTILEEHSPEAQGVSAGNLIPKLMFLTSLAGDWQSTFKQAFLDNPSAKFALNPGTAQIQSGKEFILNLLTKIDFLILNLQEAQELLPGVGPDAKSLLSKFRELGVEICVITDGMNGSYSTHQSKYFQIGCVSQGKPKERTGAGDAYTSGFLYAYLSGKQVAECMKYGAVNSDSVIKEVGGQVGLLTSAKIESKVAELDNFSAQEI